MVSQTQIRAALYNRLNQAPLVGAGPNQIDSNQIVHEQAPDETALPICVLMKQAGTQMNVMGGPNSTRSLAGTTPASDFHDAGFQTQLWVVKGVCGGAAPNSPKPAEAIDLAAAQLLNFHKLPIANGDTMFLARTSDVNLSEPVEDFIYWHVGGVYRLTFQDAAP